MDKEHFVSSIKDILISGDSKPLNDFCYKYKRDIIPKSLFKYTTLSDYSLENIANNRLCFNNPRLFNDPLDCWFRKEQVLINFEASDIDKLVSLYNTKGIDLHGEDFVSDTSLKRIAEKITGENGLIYIELIKESYKQIKNKYSNVINYGIEKLLRVVCFTETPPSQLLMWSHYGDSHKGICLEYDFSNCDEEIFQMLMPVIYSEKPYLVKFNESDLNSFYECNAYNSFLIKSKEMEYEKEWRLIKSLEDLSDEKYFHKIPLLKHIYIGLCAPYDKQESYLINIARSLNIPIFRMIRKDDSYYLDTKLIKNS